MQSPVEYCSVNDSNRSQTATLKTAFSAKVKADVSLRYVAHGYEPAGSMARWTDGYYSVRWMSCGAFQGQRYPLTKTGLQAAQAHFDRLTN